MTGRTHDLAAFTALTVLVATQPLEQMSLATAVVAFSANMLGGLAPDIDQTSASFWEKIRFGRVISRFIAPLFGKHRFVSHSIVGIAIFAVALNIVLNIISQFLIVDMEIVWVAFMVGFISHLVMDSFTKDGVPWLFPLPLRVGFPPFRAFRIKTGGVVEKSLVFPGLIFLNFYVVFSHYEKFLELFGKLG